MDTKKSIIFIILGIIIIYGISKDIPLAFVIAQIYTVFSISKFDKDKVWNELEMKSKSVYLGILALSCIGIVYSAPRFLTMDNSLRIVMLTISAFVMIFIMIRLKFHIVIIEIGAIYLGMLISILGNDAFGSWSSAIYIFVIITYVASCFIGFRKELKETKQKALEAKKKKIV